MAKIWSYTIIFYMQEYSKSPLEPDLGLCCRGFQKKKIWPVADLPPVQHSNAESPLLEGEMNSTWSDYVGEKNLVAKNEWSGQSLMLGYLITHWE
jgi:hypothetical protein